MIVQAKFMNVFPIGQTVAASRITCSTIKQFSVKAINEKFALSVKTACSLDPSHYAFHAHMRLGISPLHVCTCLAMSDIRERKRPCLKRSRQILHVDYNETCRCADGPTKWYFTSTAVRWSQNEIFSWKFAIFWGLTAKLLPEFPSVFFLVELTYLHRQPGGT